MQTLTTTMRLSVDLTEMIFWPSTSAESLMPWSFLEMGLVKVDMLSDLFATNGNESDYNDGEIRGNKTRLLIYELFMNSADGSRTLSEFVKQTEERFSFLNSSKRSTKFLLNFFILFYFISNIYFYITSDLCSGGRVLSLIRKGLFCESRASLDLE